MAETQQNSAKVDPFRNVPDVIEDVRHDPDGKLAVHRYSKGLILGKVS
jgi:hypothetical protein